MSESMSHESLGSENDSDPDARMTPFTIRSPTTAPSGRRRFPGPDRGREAVLAEDDGAFVPGPEGAAECPEGNDCETGIRTWRASGTLPASRSERRRRPSGLTAMFTTVAVTPSEASPWAAARRPVRPPVSASTTAAIRERRE